MPNVKDCILLSSKIISSHQIVVLLKLIKIDDLANTREIVMNHERLLFIFPNIDPIIIQDPGKSLVVNALSLSLETTKVQNISDTLARLALTGLYFGNTFDLLEEVRDWVDEFFVLVEILHELFVVNLVVSCQVLIGDVLESGMIDAIFVSVVVCGLPLAHFLKSLNERILMNYRILIIKSLILLICKFHPHVAFRNVHWLELLCNYLHIWSISQILIFFISFLIEPVMLKLTVLVHTFLIFNTYKLLEFIQIDLTAITVGVKKQKEIIYLIVVHLNIHLWLQGIYELVWVYE